MILPPDLLAAIAQPGGGRVVLVVGAGCSYEAPTSLPLASACAEEAHRRLRADGVLAQDCENPADLSCVADAVVAATGSQRNLVSRLPLARFRNAAANEGYILAAAMLCERAVHCMMTLNFDLAMSSALTQVGAGDDVAVISGPEDYQNLSGINLIYLHRNAHADPERWILRSSGLANEWRGCWEEVIAARVLAAPVVVFAGLGTPAGVLVETTCQIRDAIQNASSRVYLVDPGERESSPFFRALNLVEEAHLQIGWVAFMRALADRLLEECRSELQRACRELLAAERWEPEDVDGLCMRVVQLGLISLGRIRARWLLNDSAYIPRDTNTTRWLADLLLAVGLIERKTESGAVFGEDGVIEFRRNNQILGSVVLAHGCGIWGWLTMESKIQHTQKHRRNRNPRPRLAVISGVRGGRPTTTAPPQNIVIGEELDSIITGGTTLELLTVDCLRGDPTLPMRILN